MTGHETRDPAHRARCPICGKPATAEARPFCSRRCADIDLARWLGGGYAIPGAASDDEADRAREGAANPADDDGHEPE